MSKTFYSCTFCERDILSHEPVWKHMQGWSKSRSGRGGYNHFVQREDLGRYSCEECFNLIKKGEITVE